MLHRLSAVSGNEPAELIAVVTSSMPSLQPLSLAYTERHPTPALKRMRSLGKVSGGEPRSAAGFHEEVSIAAIGGVIMFAVGIRDRAKKFAVGIEQIISVRPMSCNVHGSAVRTADG